MGLLQVAILLFCFYLALNVVWSIPSVPSQTTTTVSVGRLEIRTSIPGLCHIHVDSHVTEIWSRNLLEQLWSPFLVDIGALSCVTLVLVHPVHRL